MGIVNDQVENYLDSLMPIKDPLIEKIQKEGIEGEIPIIQVQSIKLIEILLKTIQPKTMIEVGTAIGFSSIWLAKAFPNCTIHTIERKPAMIEKAKKNIEKAGLSERIILHEGNALEILPTLSKADFIFVDAAKGQYINFFELAYPLLKNKGVIVFDNILFRGYVADDDIVSSKPMLRKIKKFNDYIAKQDKVQTSFVPIGDGLAICYKTEE